MKYLKVVIFVALILVIILMGSTMEKMEDIKIGFDIGEESTTYRISKDELNKVIQFGDIMIQLSGDNIILNASVISDDDIKTEEIEGVQITTITVKNKDIIVSDFSDYKIKIGDKTIDAPLNKFSVKGQNLQFLNIKSITKSDNNPKITIGGDNITINGIDEMEIKEPTPATPETPTTPTTPETAKKQETPEMQKLLDRKKELEDEMEEYGVFSKIFYGSDYKKLEDELDEVKEEIDELKKKEKQTT